jgi:hypothetical protein
MLICMFQVKLFFVLFVFGLGNVKSAVLCYGRVYITHI